MQEIKLPAFGLAEEVLAQFMDGAQMELDRTVPQEEKVENEMSCHLVTFHLAEEEYGIGIDNVQEIIRASDITYVPGAPSHVKGVINLRGKIIPVVDLRRRFSLS
jgi:purine-binding chemotaxis protein CheW